jgi:hypothetical protein
MADEFRIEFAITRRREGEADFIEVGFGSSGTWSDVGQAAHILLSMVQNQEWETTEGMPEPETLGGASGDVDVCPPHCTCFECAGRVHHHLG